MRPRCVCGSHNLPARRLSAPSRESDSQRRELRRQAAALNELLGASRRSRDIDLFHDTEEALAASWKADRSSLEQGGYALSILRERPTFVEAEVRRGQDVVVIQWAHDSAYRFFPLLRHEELGLALHPFDLATSKVLALVGRVEPRDFIDTLTCDDALQPLGYLAWAACGKDPGFSPRAILELAGRSARYSEAELRTALAEYALVFHEGSIRGAFPRIVR